MKWIFPGLLLLLLLSAAPRRPVYRVSLTEERASLRQVLLDIHHLTGVHICYGESLFLHTVPVSFRLDSATIPELLDHACAGQPVDWQWAGPLVIIRPRNALPMANPLH